MMEVIAVILCVYVIFVLAFILICLWRVMDLLEAIRDRMPIQEHELSRGNPHPC